MKKFEKDLYRCYGDEGETIKQRLFRPIELRYLRVFRACKTKNKLLNLYFRLRLKRLSTKTQIQIPWRTEIGEGFYIGHSGRIIINPNVKIGKNVNVATGVTIGQENRGTRKGTPIIGDQVWIGTNAVIVGNVKIGNDVLIAPLAYVNFDVPDHSIVIGNPAKIISRDDATEAYINKTV